MKILQKSQQYFAVVGISSQQSNYKILLGFILLGYSLIAHLVYMICTAETFDKYIECICSTFGIVVVTTCFVCMVFGINTVSESIESIENLIETRLQYPISKALFNQTNRQVESISENIFYVIAKISPFCATLPKFFACFFMYFTTNLGNDSFELPLPIWIPFDSKTPMRFLIATTFQFIIIAYELHVIGSLISLAIGLYAFAMTSTIEITTTVHDFNEVVKEQQNSDNQSYVLQQFCVFIHAHSTVKQVSSNFSDVLQPIFMVLFSWSIIAICGLMLLIQIQIFHHENNTMALLVTIFGSGYAFGAVFIACELGQRLNDAFAEIGELMYQIDWQLFSNEFRRMMVLILAVLQQPVSFQCFGSIACERDVFKKVVNSAFSYFMMLRQFGN